MAAEAKGDALTDLLVQVGQMRADDSKWELEREGVELATKDAEEAEQKAAVVSATTVASATVAAASAATRAKPMPSIEECRQAQDSCGSDGSA